MEGAVVVGKLLERNAEADYGYNAATNTYQDLVKAGIIDPLKVHPSSCVALLKQCDWTSQSVHDQAPLQSTANLRIASCIIHSHQN